MTRLLQKAYSRLHLLSFHSFGLYILCAPGAYSAYYSRPSTTHWVFWYYGSGGNRECGNICIITFVAVCILLLLLLYRIYAIWKSNRWEKKLDNIQLAENGTETTGVGGKSEKSRLSSSSESRIEQGYGVNNEKKSDGTSDFIEHAGAGPVAPPPAYNKTSYSTTVPTPSYSMSSMSSTAPLLPSKFAAENPPHDLPPLREQVASILYNGAAETYKLAPVDELLDKNLLKVDSDGTTATFNGTRVSCLSNNPFLVIKKSDFANDNDNVLYPPLQTPSSSPPPPNLATTPSHQYSPTTQYFDPTNVTYKMPAPQTEVKISIPSSLSSIAEVPNSPVETNEQTGLLKKNIDIKKLKEKEKTDADEDKGELCYFEMTVLENEGRNNTIAVGVATQPYPWSSFPGYYPHSVSLNTSGYVRVSSHTAIPYSNAWGTIGDTVGCGYYPKTGEVFFTINGTKRQVAYTGPQHVWHPCIGADGKCKVKVDFGEKNGDTFVFSEARGSGSAVVID